MASWIRSLYLLYHWKSGEMMEKRSRKMVNVAWKRDRKVVRDVLLVVDVEILEGYD